MNKPLIVIDYWSKEIEEYFYIRTPDKNNLSDKSTTQDVKNVMNIMVKHVNSMEKGMLGLKENFIESENERPKQSICIDQLIQENISTQTYLHQLI